MRRFCTVAESSRPASSISHFHGEKDPNKRSNVWLLGEASHAVIGIVRSLSISRDFLYW